MEQLDGVRELVDENKLFQEPILPEEQIQLVLVEGVELVHRAEASGVDNGQLGQGDVGEDAPQLDVSSLKKKKKRKEGKKSRDDRTTLYLRTCRLPAFKGSHFLLPRASEWKLATHQILELAIKNIDLIETIVVSPLCM